MLSGIKFYKDFLLLNADSRRVLQYATEISRNWDYGTVSVYEIGDRLAIFFWEDPKADERIKKRAPAIAGALILFIFAIKTPTIMRETKRT